LQELVLEIPVRDGILRNSGDWSWANTLWFWRDESNPDPSLFEGGLDVQQVNT
jgi:hypothetical protein